MKKLSYVIFLAVVIAVSCSSEREVNAVIETSLGDITIMLYNSTPKHRDNFVELARDNFYNGLLFHRVMSNFMIQGGDPQSRDAPQDLMLGSGGPGYTIDAEIGELHFRGAVAAARLPDNVNPQKASSGSQFYIVHGLDITDEYLDEIQRIRNIQYTPEQRNEYKLKGGYPGLDYDYTVFGQVIEGMEVLEQIANVQTNANDRPVEDVMIETIRIL
jgi:cyclophilin family peptidyl-prolyl cis-trans isomerase